MALAFGQNTLNLANVVLNAPQFEIWSGSGHSFVHHYGKGGLAQHTLEVTELCMLNNEYFTRLEKGVESSELFLAAVFHDVGKFWDYAPLEADEYYNAPIDYYSWHGTEDRERVYHISRSAITWSKAFDQYGHHLTPKAHDDILHAILAHHGRLEWKSPVTPKTRMAWILHLSDNMSARVDDCVKPRPKPVYK